MICRVFFFLDGLVLLIEPHICVCIYVRGENPPCVNIFFPQGLCFKISLHNLIVASL